MGRPRESATVMARLNEEDDQLGKMLWKPVVVRRTKRWEICGASGERADARMWEKAGIHVAVRSWNTRVSVPSWVPSGTPALLDIENEQDAERMVVQARYLQLMGSRKHDER